MIQLTDVVKNLIILNVVLYLVTILGFPYLRDWLIFHYPGSGGAGFQPLQIITHMFMHGQDGVTRQSLMSMHLLFNMIGIFFFGPRLEILWGAKRFLFYYLFTGLGALFLHVAINYIEINYFGGIPSNVLGASGAVVGLLVAFAYHFFDQPVTLMFPPISLSPVTLVLGLLSIDLYLGLTGAEDGIAHFAHLGGGLFGYILIQYWNKFGSRL